MIRFSASLILAVGMFTAGCGSLESSEAIVVPTSTSTSALASTPTSSSSPPSSEPSLAIQSGATIPEVLAFSADDCAGFNGLEPGVDLESVLPVSTHGSIEPISELLTAVEITGRRAEQRFESVQAAIESDAPLASTTSTTSRSEELDEMQRLLDAMIDPALVPISASLAERVDETCGPTDLGTLLWRINEHAARMQVSSTAEYCDALVGADPNRYAPLAPPEHAEWIEAMLAIEEAESLNPSAGAEGSLRYYQVAQCGEDLSEVFD